MVRNVKTGRAINGRNIPVLGGRGKVWSGVFQYSSFSIARVDI